MLPADAGQLQAGHPNRPNMFKSFLRDEAEILTSPLNINGDDVLWLATAATVTAALIATDEATYRTFRDYRNNHDWVRRTSPVATQLGEFYVPYSVAALYCLKGLAFKDDDAMDTGLLSVQAMIHSAIAVQILKHLFGRTRPYVKDGQDRWHGPNAFFKRYSGGFSNYDAFPSGHTITAFSLAAVIAERSEQTWVAITAYTLAGLCGLSRLTEHDHWLSDVAVGAAMGVAIGKLVVRNHKRPLDVEPAFSSRSAGVSLQWSY